MTILSELYLNNNNIVGRISLIIGHITNLRKLDRSWNQINDPIPIEIANCTSLEYLNLSHNHLTGSTPFDNKNNLSTLTINLSYISLKGNVMLSLIYLIDFNLSYNSVEGQIPEIYKYYGFHRFIGNKDLCGDIKDFVPCPPSPKTMCHVKIWVPLSLFFFCAFTSWVYPSLSAPS